MNLADLIDSRQNELLGLWRIKVRSLPSATNLKSPALTDNMPQVLLGLVQALRADDDHMRADQMEPGPPVLHGIQRLDLDFDIGEVLGEYAIMQELVLDLAHQHDVDIRGRPAHIITRYFARSMTAAAEVYVSSSKQTTAHASTERPSARETLRDGG